MSETTAARFTSVSLAIARIGMGWVFFWAFMDKTFGLGWTTPSDRAWVNGGSPTRGYLMSRSGWFEEVFHGMADSSLVSWLFMLGLLGVGLSLILGIGMRIGTISGITMLLLMFLASVPFRRDAGQTNPLWDSHLTEAAILLVLLALRAGDHYGLGKRWAKVKWVNENRWLL